MVVVLEVICNRLLRGEKKTISKNGVLDESVRKITESKHFFGAHIEQRVWVTMSFVPEEKVAVCMLTR